MRRIRVLEAASIEATEAAAWYEAARPGLGAQFNLALDAALDLLESDMAPLVPLPAESGAQSAKRLILKRFPFDVVVALRGDEAIVIAIAHQARRPGYWRGRGTAQGT
jgi:toxin ParE1/3/4